MTDKTEIMAKAIRGVEQADCDEMAYAAEKALNDAGFVIIPKDQIEIKRMTLDPGTMAMVKEAIRILNEPVKAETNDR